MAEPRAFKGTFSMDAAVTASTDMSAYFVEKTGGWQREAVQIEAVLSTDHRYQIPGVRFAPLGLRLRGLTDALSLTFRQACDAGTLCTASLLANTGSKAADNPLETYQFYLLNGPMIPGSLTKDYVWEISEIECISAVWSNGVDSDITWGTVQS